MNSKEFHHEKCVWQRVIIENGFQSFRLGNGVDPGPAREKEVVKEDMSRLS